MSTPKKAKTSPAPERDQVVVTLPEEPCDPVVIEHLRGGKLAGSISVHSPVLWPDDVAKICIRHVFGGGSLQDIERRAVKEYFDRETRR